MKIELKEIPVRDIIKGYSNEEEEGVYGYFGKLNIRPKYQREFVYADDKRDAVINTILSDFPLNVMYWAVCDDGEYEIIDGQQRTLSICMYVNGDFSFNGLYFFNQLEDVKEKILSYPLMIYFCSGTPSEKLSWFETINIAGEKLTAQELKNATFAGSWVSDAKRYFSKNICPAYGIANKYLSGSAIRQDYLETAIKWISNNDIKGYMAKNQFEPNANELWLYFQSVINWVKTIFPQYRTEMKGLDWGFLYNEYKDQKFDSKSLEAQITALMMDDEIGNRKGIYPYVLTGKEKFLNIRTFTDNVKRLVYEKQEGICPNCKLHFEITEMEGDHITPWHEGGKTVIENCQMLCKECNRRKGGK